MLCHSFQAYKALDQLHHIDLNERKERFILSYLEPDVGKGNVGVKSPVSLYCTNSHASKLIIGKKPELLLFH